MASARQRVKPFTEQEPFLYDSHRYYTYASGVGSGKSAVGLIRAVTNVEVWNPGFMGAIVAPTAQMVKNAIFPLMREFGVRDRWEYHSPQSEEPGFHAPNGSRVLVMSADNDRTIERLAGLNLSWFWVDEARDVPERALQILIQRLRKGNYRNGFLTSTPRKNHLYEFAIEPDMEEWTHGAATVSENARKLTISGVTPEANPYVAQEDIDAIRAAHPDALEAQEVEGQWVDPGAGVYTQDMFTFIDADDLGDLRFQTVIAIDPAATVDAQRAEARDSDYWAVVVGQAHPRKNRLYITDVARRRGMTLQQGCEWIGQIASTAQHATVVCETNQAQEWLQSELANHGVHAQGHKSSREKEARLMDLTIPISNSTIQFVRFEDGEDAYTDLIAEALGFPDGSHDDTLDALALCAEYAPVRLGANIMGADMWGDEREDDDEGDPRYA